MRGDIKEIKPLQIYYDIDTEQGQSGAPLFVDLGNENYFAIGIHAGNDSQSYNSACKITAEMIKTIK
jgi:V8-like Glu-specific endopeptidase